MTRHAIAVLLTLSAGCGGGGSSSSDSLSSTTLSAYDEVDEVLTMLDDIVRRAADPSLSEQERLSLQQEVDALLASLDAGARKSQWNGIRLLWGSHPTWLEASGNATQAGTPWNRIRDAVSRLAEGNQTVTFSYSFILPGTQTDFGAALEMKDHIDGSVDSVRFKQEIREALAAWEDLFEKVFHTGNGYGGNLEVKFVDLGDETGNSFPSRSGGGIYAVPGTENIGDLRFGMTAFQGTGSPHSPTGKSESGNGDESGDVHFSSYVNWRLDSQSSGSGMTSVKIVAAHEIGHGFAFGHDETSSKTIMTPSILVSGSFDAIFSEGLFFAGSPDVAGIVAMYGTGVSRRGAEGGVELPAVNAAALGISAMKVRTVEEVARSAKLLAAAKERMAQYRASIR